VSADKVLRESVLHGLEIPPLPPASFTTPPPLNEARVAVVTTAGIMRPGEKAWSHDDTDFRVFKGDEPDLIIGHISMSFDRAGVSADRNVAIPLDRLAELADDGVIGSVADRHISFMGALRTSELLSTLILDSGPAAAKVLRDDGVDVVVLTPMCPACARTVTVLGHILEDQGLATVVLASNRVITERARPPRALYCEFPLGRPLGRPLDIPFQRQVLEAALDLLNRPEGPVLEIFPEVIIDEVDTAVACVMPPRYDSRVPAAVDEARGLRPAWERTAKTHPSAGQVGRRITVDEVPMAIERFVAVAGGAGWREKFDDPDELFQTLIDVRVYYEEAALSLVDHVPAARAAETWFYQHTETGALLRRMAQVLSGTGQMDELGFLAHFYIVPLSQIDGDRNVAPWHTLNAASQEVDEKPNRLGNEPCDD